MEEREKEQEGSKGWMEMRKKGTLKIDKKHSM